MQDLSTKSLRNDYPVSKHNDILLNPKLITLKYWRISESVEWWMSGNLVWMAEAHNLSSGLLLVDSQMSPSVIDELEHKSATTNSADESTIF